MRNEEILMRKSRFAEARIRGILRQVESGMGLADACREHAISSATFYKRRSKYGGMDASIIADMKVMEEANRRLKKMFAELSMQNELQKKARGKNNAALWRPRGLAGIIPAQKLKQQMAA
jgi:putative transposase